MNKGIVLLAAILLASPAWAIHKCKGPDGKLVYSDHACETTHTAEDVKIWGVQKNSERSSVPSVRSDTTDNQESREEWKFVRSEDDMTGNIFCFAVSPSGFLVDTRRHGGFKKVVMAFGVTRDEATFMVRLDGEGLFHNDLHGMGVKPDNAEFMPLDIKGNQNVVSSSQSKKILEALRTANSARLRVRFWPYDDTLDTLLPITMDGFADAMEQAQQCAESEKN